MVLALMPCLQLELGSQITFSYVFDGGSAFAVLHSSSQGFTGVLGDPGYWMSCVLALESIKVPSPASTMLI